MNNTTKFLQKIRHLLNAKGVEKAGKMPANALGDFYSRSGAGKNPALSENALLGLIRALSPVIIAGCRFEYENGLVFWYKYVREDRECQDVNGVMEHYTVEHRGILQAEEIGEFVNALQWPDETQDESDHFGVMRKVWEGMEEME